MSENEDVSYYKKVKIASDLVLRILSECIDIREVHPCSNVRAVYHVTDMLDNYAERKVCEWKPRETSSYVYFSSYQTGCFDNFLTENKSSLKSHGYKYCPYCGGEIKEVKNEP